MFCVIRLLSDKQVKQAIPRSCVIFLSKIDRIVVFFLFRLKKGVQFRLNYTYQTVTSPSFLMQPLPLLKVSKIK